MSLERQSKRSHNRRYLEEDIENIFVRLGKIEKKIEFLEAKITFLGGVIH